MAGATDPASPSLERMVLFRAGGERFALPLEAVQEVVVPQPPFARVPRAAEAVRGAMNLRGRVVVVVELAPLLGLTPDRLSPAQGYVLLIDGERRSLGLLVASVVGVEKIARATARSPSNGALAESVVDLHGVPVTVLDAKAVEVHVTSLFQST